MAVTTERQSTRVSKIKNDGLDQYGAEPFEQQQFGTAGIEVVKTYLDKGYLCSLYSNYHALSTADLMLLSQIQIFDSHVQIKSKLFLSKSDCTRSECHLLAYVHCVREKSNPLCTFL